MKVRSEDDALVLQSGVGVRMVMLDEVEDVHEAEEDGDEEYVLIAGGVCVFFFVPGLT